MKSTYEELQLQVAAAVAENAALKTVLEEIINADQPEYHDQGMGCGVEDRGYQRDGYSACYYGWESAMERVYSEVIPNSLPETPATDAFLDEVRASAIPDGWKLVPEQMYLDAEDVQSICMQCGNGDKKGYGDYEDGILWIGELSNDGEMKYGLNIANANYPEEGSITVFEFDEPSFAAQLRQGAKQ